jgi:hypothetical protein
MINRCQKDYLEKWAYLPEHLVAYVTAVQEVEPFLQDNYLFYVGEAGLVVIGYPLGEEFSRERFARMLTGTERKFPRATTAIITPGEPPDPEKWILKSSDYYYELSLSSLIIPAKTRNMIKRAARDLFINPVAALGEEQQKLIAHFLASRELDPGTRSIMQQLPAYVSSAAGVKIWEARNAAGKLVAFDIADFTSYGRAMHLFNFTSDEGFVPGACDLLFAEMLAAALREGKETFNLGLGINPGVTFFKTKWGARPAYACNYYLRQEEEKGDLFFFLPR